MKPRYTLIFSCRRRRCCVSQGKWSKMLNRTSPVSLSVPTASTIEVFSTVIENLLEGPLLAASRTCSKVLHMRTQGHIAEYLETCWRRSAWNTQGVECPQNGLTLS